MGVSLFLCSELLVTIVLIMLIPVCYAVYTIIICVDYLSFYIITKYSHRSLLENCVRLTCAV